MTSEQWSCDLSYGHVTWQPKDEAAAAITEREREDGERERGRKKMCASAQGKCSLIIMDFSQ